MISLKPQSFGLTLQIIANNIEQCIIYNFDEIEELSRYVYEDWRNVCTGKIGIENWYLDIGDLELKRKLNEEFEEAALSVEKILGTNFIIPRKWYSCDELISIGKEYTTRKKYWDEIIEILKRTNGYYQSTVKLFNIICYYLQSRTKLCGFRLIIHF